MADDDFENVYYLAGDTEEDKIAFPYNWTLTDVMFVYQLLTKHFHVGAAILYGNEHGTSKII